MGSFRIFIFLFILPLVSVGQVNSDDCAIIEPIETYNLRKSLIDNQGLAVWPNIIEIKQLETSQDSIILFMVEIDGGNYIRISTSADLTIFYEVLYKNDCPKEGTIETDLKIGIIDYHKKEVEVLCQTRNYCILTL